MNDKQKASLQKLADVTCIYPQKVSVMEMLYDLTNALGLEVLEDYVSWKKDLMSNRILYNHDKNNPPIGHVNFVTKEEDGSLTIVINVAKERI